jgi:hypothetical protein
MRTIGLLLLVGGIALSAEQVQAQNWRRESAGAFGQVHAPGVRQHKSDPTASSDTFRPGGSYTDPTASSDPYVPSIPSWYPPAQPVYPPTQPVYPPVQPTYPSVQVWYPPTSVQPVAKFLGVTTAATWDGRGVYVTHVTPYSAAFRIGIEPGDIIYSIDGVAVSSPQQLAHAIRYSDGFVEIYLRDVRTGQTIMRNADLTQ